MRDIKNEGSIHVYGNMEIADNSHVFRPIAQLSTNELLQEREFRVGNYRQEQTAKNKRLIKTAFFSVIGAIILASATYLSGHSNLAFFILAVGTLIIGFQTLKGSVANNQFQQQEKDAIDTITLILRSRRVE